MSFSIAGKTAIVTGAADGCGLAIGRHFLEEGANVIFTDGDEDLLRHELADDLTDTGPARIFAGDLREKLAVANLLSTTIDAFDRIDILVNAARHIKSSDPLDPAEDHVEDMLDLNLIAPLRLSQMAAAQMIRQAKDDDKAPRGAIVNLSSIAARRTQPELFGYSIASAGLEQLTRSMAVSLASHRIRVNAVALGSVMSASLQKLLRDDDPLRRRIIESTPMGRIAPAGELARSVQYLASDASGFMTGQIISLDGGRTLIDPVVGPAH